jgi:hypothetical protein
MSKPDKVKSNIKKMPKQPPVPRTYNVDAQVNNIIGIDMNTMNEAQKKTYQHFMDVFHQIQHNPFAERALMTHYHGIPNSPQFIESATEKSMDRMKSNSAVVSSSYVDMVRELQRNIFRQYDKPTLAIKEQMKESSAKFDDPRFIQYFDASMARLKELEQFIPHCNDKLAELLDGFRKRNKRSSFVQPNQVPHIKNPESKSRMASLSNCASVQMIEMLTTSMTDADLKNNVIRNTRCCLKGEQCAGRILYNKSNLFSTSKIPDIIMYRMRPYWMLACNTWEGDNPYTKCFFCVHDMFWEDAIENSGFSRPQSINLSTPIVKSGNGDPTAFPTHLCSTKTDPRLKNVANLEHAILIPNIIDHFTYRNGGFKFNGSRFP